MVNAWIQLSMSGYFPQNLPFFLVLESHSSNVLLHAAFERVNLVSFVLCCAVQCREPALSAWSMAKRTTKATYAYIPWYAVAVKAESDTEVRKASERSLQRVPFISWDDLHDLTLVKAETTKKAPPQSYEVFFDMWRYNKQSVWVTEHFRAIHRR